MSMVSFLFPFCKCLSPQRGHDLQVKISEMETYREILCRQIDTLQVYFDTLAEANAQGEDNADLFPYQ